MPTLEERIQIIEDRDAIRELTARYCQLAYAGNADAVADLFTSEGVMEMGETFERGRERLRKLYRDSFTEVQPIPMIHNHVVDLDGDQAKGYCSVELRMVEAGEAVTAAGHYDDQFEREGGTWKFAHRKLTFYHRVKLKDGWS